MERHATSASPYLPCCSSANAESFEGDCARQQAPPIASIATTRIRRCPVTFKMDAPIRFSRASEMKRNRRAGKRARQQCAAPGDQQGSILEYDLAAQLQCAGTIVTCYLAKVCVLVVHIHALRADVVKGIERLEAQVDVDPFRR